MHNEAQPLVSFRAQAEPRRERLLSLEAVASRLSYRLMHAHQLRSIRERGFDLDELDHFRVRQRAAPPVRDAVGDELAGNTGRSQDQADYPAPFPGSLGDAQLVAISRRAEAAGRR